MRLRPRLHFSAIPVRRAGGAEKIDFCPGKGEFPRARLLMKYFLCLTLALGMAGNLAAVAATNDVQAIQGQWHPVQAELATHPLPNALLQSIRLQLTAGKYEAMVGTEPDRGTYTLDLAQTPKGMSITGTAGPNQGKTFPAIYELTGDTLRICYDLSGTKRPAAFQTLPGTKLYLVTYQRK